MTAMKTVLLLLAGAVATGTLGACGGSTQAVQTVQPEVAATEDQ